MCMSGDLFRPLCAHVLHAHILHTHLHWNMHTCREQYTLGSMGVIMGHPAGLANPHVDGPSTFSGTQAVPYIITPTPHTSHRHPPRDPHPSHLHLHPTPSHFTHTSPLTLTLHLPLHPYTPHTSPTPPPHTPSRHSRPEVLHCVKARHCSQPVLPREVLGLVPHQVPQGPLVLQGMLLARVSDLHGNRWLRNQCRNRISSSSYHHNFILQQEMLHLQYCSFSCRS